MLQLDSNTLQWKIMNLDFMRFQMDLTVKQDATTWSHIKIALHRETNF